MKKSNEYINEKVFKVNQKYARLQNKTEELFFRCLDEERSVEYFIKKLDEIWGNIDHSYIQEDINNYIDMIQEYNLYMLGLSEEEKKNYKTLKYRKLEENDYKTIGLSFSESARKHNIVVHTCAEKRNLTEYGFIQDECMSRELAFKLTGKIYKKWNARKNVPCKCIEMADIGVYNSCKHFCKYCYANFDEKKVIDNFNKHNPKSSLLIGELEKDDIIKIRK